MGTAGLLTGYLTLYNTNHFEVEVKSLLKLPSMFKHQL